MDVDPNWMETFICAMESKPCLYNKADGDYCNRDVKAKAWTEVCETIVQGWEGMSDEDREFKSKEIQQRWTSLRHSFLRELREQKKSKSGQAAKKRRKYIYFDQLLFLLPTLEQRETVSNFQPDEDEIAEMTETTESPGDVAKEPVATTSAACHTTPKTSKKKRSSDTSYEQKLLDILSERADKAEEIDEDKSFLLSFLPAMRRMSQETKFEAKLEVMKIMHRFELRDRSLPRPVLPDRSRATPEQVEVSNYNPYQNYSTLSRNQDFFRPIDANNSNYQYQLQLCSRTPSATSSYSDSLSYQNEDTF